MNPTDTKNTNPQRRKGGGGRGGKKQSQEAIKLHELAPLTGTAVKCGCLGTRHGSVTNCLHCGYILCMFEVRQQKPEAKPETLGTDMEMIYLCPMCNTTCTNPFSSQQARTQGFDESTVKAYAQKDKLLQFDRERTKRTHVHDAQGDYYVSSPWMTEDERKEMELKERKRLEMKKLANQKRKVNIRFDIAGRKIFDVLPEEELDAEDNTNNMTSSTVCSPNLDQVDDQSYPELDGNGFVSDHKDEWNPTMVENSELMLSTSKAAEIYRQMRRS